MRTGVGHLLAAAVVAMALGTAGAQAPAAPGGEWREARWGMTVEEILRAFPGEAVRLDPEEKLADGNVVAAGIDRYPVAATDFRVRFVFEGRRLALVSLRTPPDRYAGPEVFERVRGHLAEALGSAGELTSDDNFIDLRQVRWRLARGVVDLKYIPGVVVILHHRPGAPDPPQRGG